MPLFQRAKSLAGETQSPLDFVMDKMRESLVYIYQSHDWSFQRGITYANWLAPGNVASDGSSTVTPYSNQVLMNGAATAAINTYTSNPGSGFLTQLQYRDPRYSNCNIIGVTLSGTIGYLTITDQGYGQIPGVYQVNVLDANN